MVSDLISLPGFSKNQSLFYHCPTDICITENKEKLLNNLGFITLCESKYTPYPVFYNCQTVQAIKTYNNPQASANAQISIQLQYILCASRFAHYLKIMIRNQLGRFTTAEACQSKLQNWLLQYTAASSDLSIASKAKYPLRAANIHIQQSSSKPDRYICIIHLNPHCQIDNVDATLQLFTEVKL